jgi:hypothetical protein
LGFCDDVGAESRSSAARRQLKGVRNAFPLQMEG